MTKSTSVAVITNERTFEQRSAESRSTKKISISVTKERVTTVISEATKLTGDLCLQEGIKIDGHIKGNVTFGQEDGLCIVAKSSTVEGNLYGPRALIMGTIEGDVFIHGLLMLAPTAIVLGNVHYERLIVHDGAQIAGGMRAMGSRAIAAPKNEADMSAKVEPEVVRHIRAA